MTIDLASDRANKRILSPGSKSSADDRRYEHAFAGLMICLAAVVAVSFRSYGFSTDEDNGLVRATAILNFLKSFGLSTQGISELSRVNVYGAMPDVIALTLQQTFPSLGLDSRHLVSAAFGISGIYFTYRLGEMLSGKAAGFYAGLFLAVNPMWFGYMFINAKDIPFAALLLAASYYCSMALLGRGNLWIWPKVALAVGSFACTKLTGLIILGFVTLVCVCAVEWGNRERRAINVKIFFQRALLVVTASSIGCLFCFLFFWPQFYFFSIGQIVDVIRLFTNYNDWSNSVLIFGNTYLFDKIPSYYMISYFMISMPLFLVVLTILGLMLTTTRRTPLIAASVICIFFFSYQAATKTLVYGGYRHFIFLLPFTSLLAAAPVKWLLEKRNVLAGYFVAGGVAACTILSIGSMYRLFPYQYSSYNFLVGGLPGADGRFYVDVWRTSMREAFLAIEAADTSGAKLKVFSCGSSLNYADHPRFESVTNPARANYIVSLRRGCPHELFQQTPAVGDVSREGVIFSRIFVNKEPQP